MEKQEQYGSYQFIGSILLGSFFAGMLGAAAIVFALDLQDASSDSYLAGSVVSQEKGNTDATISVVDIAAGAVVSIQVEKEVSADSPISFEDFFGGAIMGDPLADGSEPLRYEVGGGTGFIVQENGLIVTNRHVVADDNATYTVMLADGREFVADVLARDPVLDVALLRINAENLPILQLGDSSSLQQGQTVVAIGNALAEFGNTVTRGVISGIGRRIEASDSRGRSEVLHEAIQTDAAINPGNSGGPLLNLAGHVIGINTAVSSRGQSVGFAIPINSVRKTIESVQEHGRIVRPWVGIRYIPVTPRLAEEEGLAMTYGALIVRASGPEDVSIIPGSPAEEAGLIEGDIIIEIDGEALDEKDSLATIISTFSVGDTIILSLVRNGVTMQQELTLQEFPIFE